MSNPLFVLSALRGISSLRTMFPPAGVVPPSPETALLLNSFVGFCEMLGILRSTLLLARSANDYV